MHPLFKKFIPPIIFDLRNKFRQSRLEYIPNGWSVPRSDYNDELLVQKQIKKFNRLVGKADTESSNQAVLDQHELNCAQIAALIAARGKTEVRILDFGGALGIYYRYIQKVLPHPFKLEYHISEVPKICEVGRKLSPEITFHEKSLPQGQFDLIMISGTLQYIQAWQDLLHQLPACDYLYLPRTPVTASEAFTVKDYFGGVSQPIIFEVRNQGVLEDFIISSGFELLTEFSLPSFPPVKNAPAEIFYANWLFKKINLSS